MTRPRPRSGRARDLNAEVQFDRTGQMVALLVNATEAMPQGGTLRLCTQGDTESLQLSIADHPLLAEESRPHYRMLIEEFDRMLATYGAGHHFELTDNLGLTHRFALYELPTGVGAPAGG